MLGKTAAVNAVGINAANVLSNVGLLIRNGGPPSWPAPAAIKSCNSSNVKVLAGGTFDLNGKSEAIDGLFGAGTATIPTARRRYSPSALHP